MKVGFAGAGLMGHGVARNMIEKGHDLLVLAHRNRAPVDDLVGRGAVEVTCAVATAITTALEAGVDPHRMRDVISVSGGKSVSFQRLSKVATGEDAGGGGALAIANGLKDVAYFKDLADAAGV